MCDLFGDWVKGHQIRHIIYITTLYPQHRFLFLTKNPKRYREFEFPKNCWLGATIDCGGEKALNQSYSLVQQ